MISDAIKITDCFENESESEDRTMVSIIDRAEEKLSSSLESDLHPPGDRKLFDF
jgi:hypothetical protein